MVTIKVKELNMVSVLGLLCIRLRIDKSTYLIDKKFASLL